MLAEINDLIKEINNMKVSNNCYNIKDITTNLAKAVDGLVFRTELDNYLKSESRERYYIVNSRNLEHLDGPFFNKLSVSNIIKNKNYKYMDYKNSRMEEESKIELPYKLGIYKNTGEWEYEDIVFNDKELNELNSNKATYVKAKIEKKERAELEKELESLRNKFHIQSSKIREIGHEVIELMK